MSYSRAEPSPRYREMVALYGDLHDNGDRHNDVPAERTFNGISLQPHVQAIGMLIARFGAKTLLDYGAGKGDGYTQAQARTPEGRLLRGLKEIWGLRRIALYDPGYKPHSKLPKGVFDAVISTDVIEHCPEEDVDWILGELFGYATRFVFITVACYPARKLLPTGENAHITLKSPGWWVDRLATAAAGHPDIRWFAVIETERGGGRLMIEG